MPRKVPIWGKDGIVCAWRLPYKALARIPSQMGEKRASPPEVGLADSDHSGAVFGRE